MLSVGLLSMAVHERFVAKSFVFHRLPKMLDAINCDNTSTVRHSLPHLMGCAVAGIIDEGKHAQNVYLSPEIFNRWQCADAAALFHNLLIANRMRTMCAGIKRHPFFGPTSADSFPLPASFQSTVHNSLRAYRGTFVLVAFQFHLTTREYLFEKQCRNFHIFPNDFPG